MMDNEEPAINTALRRGRPRKELGELSTRSLRRRIGEDFNPPPEPPSSRDLLHSPSDDENKGKIHGSGDFFGDSNEIGLGEDLDCAGSGIDINLPSSSDPRHAESDFFIPDNLQSDDEGGLDEGLFGT